MSITAVDQGGQCHEHDAAACRCPVAALVCHLPRRSRDYHGLILTKVGLCYTRSRSQLTLTMALEMDTVSHFVRLVLSRSSFPVNINAPRPISEVMRCAEASRLFALLAVRDNLGQSPTLGPPPRAIVPHSLTCPLWLRTARHKEFLSA